VELGGVFYGVSLSGGTYDNGTIFRINPDGTGFEVLHSFNGAGFEGEAPGGALLASGGVLYGVAESGGARLGGTVFRINPDGTGFSVLHAFIHDSLEGDTPTGPLITSGGALYGIASRGGGSTCITEWPDSLGCGTIFGVKPDGSGFDVVHAFTDSPMDGIYPVGPLLGLGGVLLGVTPGGGANHAGAIFEANPDGKGFGLLHSFSGGASDGASPMGPLADIDGALYGTTTAGGSSDLGTIFRANEDGSNVVLLHSFHGTDGERPVCSLTKLGWRLYGTAGSGAIGDGWVIFGLDLGAYLPRRHLTRE